MEESAPPEDSTSAEIGQKREAPEPVDEEDTRTFKLKRKKLDAGLG